MFASGADEVVLDIGIYIKVLDRALAHGKQPMRELRYRTKE
jgi:hypothetical protein